MHHIADGGLHGLDVRVQLDGEVRRARAMQVAESIPLNFLDGSLFAKRIMKADLTVVAHHYDKGRVKWLLYSLVMHLKGLLRLETDWHEATWAVPFTILCSHTSLLLQRNWRLHGRRTWLDVLTHW